MVVEIELFTPCSKVSKGLNKAGFKNKKKPNLPKRTNRAVLFSSLLRGFGEAELWLGIGCSGATHKHEDVLPP